jgi:prepilin-type N-terminal cleavage/methylation domain-containing protein
MKTTKSQKGFTLLEVLLVVGIITILAAIVIVAINPSKQFGDAKNAQRRGDVNTVLNAVYQYSIDNGGNLPGPGVIPTSPTFTEVCRTTPAVDCTGLIDLAQLTNSGTYLVSLPIDPQETDTDSTGYEISKDANNRLTVRSANNNAISATR